MAKKKHKRRGIEQVRDQQSQSKNKKSAEYMDYEVGYGRPPIHSRFKKGQSGNPAGRTKEPTTFLATLNKALSKPINLVEDGRKCQITTLMGVVKMYIKGLLSPNNYKYMQLFIKGNAPNVNIESNLYPQPVKEPESEDERRERMAMKEILRGMIKQKLDAGEPVNGYPPNSEETPPEHS